MELFLIHCMEWLLEQVCYHYPEELELELLVLNVLRIFVLVAGSHDLVPVARMPVVEYLLCLELAVMMLLLQK